MNKIAVISLGAGGTMGHMNLTTTLAKAISTSSRHVYIMSEVNYGSYSHIPSYIKCIKLPYQAHQETIGGKLDYKYGDIFAETVRKNKIEGLIFSTFFDPTIISHLRNYNIKAILVSYPFRDSHRSAFKLNKYYNCFDQILTLKDVCELQTMASNETIVSPIKDKLPKHQSGTSVKKILITCGGGGRPSARRFMQLIETLICRIQKKAHVTFTVVRGHTEKRPISCDNTINYRWSKRFDELLNTNDLIISEAGYNTMIDLICKHQPSILIPGARRIDNQELRAIGFQERNLGKVFFPEENVKKLINIVEELIGNPCLLKQMAASFSEVEKEIFGNKPLDKVVLEWMK